MGQNTSGATLTYQTIVLPSNMLVMDPESQSVTSRWTAPSSGIWSVSGLFQGIDTGEGFHNVEIVVDNTTFVLGPTTLNAYGQQVPFNYPNLSLNQGDTVDFIVASTGSPNNLSTGLAVEIAKPSLITWTDTNNGNIATSAAWSDHVVVTNTTTGHTLATVDVPYNPNQLGAIAPGGSVARQLPFALPVGNDGGGNIQITVTTNAYHTGFAQPGILTNVNLCVFRSSVPAAPAMLAVGGVDFALVPSGTATNSLGVISPATTGSAVDIPVNIVGAASVYTLINSAYGELGDKVGTVEFRGTGGADVTFNLVEGTNIRDWVNDGYNSAIAGGTPSATFDNGATRFDMQTFVLPNAFASATLTDIILTNVGGNPQGIPFLTAATVATTSGTPQLVLLGGGTAPDVTNSATITVTAVGSLRGQVSLGLDAGSDSGTKGDGRTNVAGQPLMLL